MPLIMKKHPMPQAGRGVPLLVDQRRRLSEMDGVGIIKGERYLLKLGRKSIDRLHEEYTDAANPAGGPRRRPGAAAG